MRFLSSTVVTAVLLSVPTIASAETGATAVSVPEPVRGVDLVVVTIPEKNIPGLPAGL